MLLTATAFAENETPNSLEADTIIGAASFYDIPGETASGEQYDPKAFTAAVQLDIRDKFGGIKFGSLYRVAFALAEYSGKKLILKFNDVGPLRPGRKFDLSRAAMEYFDGIEKGVLPELKVTVLPIGQGYTPGPVTEEELAALGFGKANFKLASAEPADGHEATLEEGAIGSPGAPTETSSATAVPIDARVDLARACGEPSTAAAQIDSPATAAEDREPANVQVASAKPVIELDHWQVIEMWPPGDDAYDGDRDGACSSGGC